MITLLSGADVIGTYLYIRILMCKIARPQKCKILWGQPKIKHLQLYIYIYILLYYIILKSLSLKRQFLNTFIKWGGGIQTWDVSLESLGYAIELQNS